MRLIDRYLFRQIMSSTVLAGLALSAVAVLAEALSALGLILTQRQSLSIFAKVIVLAMPQLVVLILPVAVLIGGLVAVNRLQRDSELTICFASGMTRWRVMAPAIRLSALIALLSLSIGLWVQPLCYRALRDTLDGVRTDLVTNLVRPGQFTHPAPGVTVYARAVDEDGTIHDLFIDRRLDDGRDSTIMARNGRLQRQGAAPFLVLQHGANQDLSASGILTLLSFDNYILDLRPLARKRSAISYKPSDKYLHELLFPILDGALKDRYRSGMFAEAISRVTSPIYNLTFSFLALLAILGAGFSRMGYAARMASVATVALVTRMLGFAAQTASGVNPALNLLQFGVPISVSLIAVWVLFSRSREPLNRPAPGRTLK